MRILPVQSVRPLQVNFCLAVSDEEGLEAVEDTIIAKASAPMKEK